MPLPTNSWKSHVGRKSLSNSVAKQNKSLEKKTCQITGQQSRKYPTDSGRSYVATQNAQSSRTSEHKEIKMIITSEADIMFDVLTG